MTDAAGGNIRSRALPRRGAILNGNRVEIVEGVTWRLGIRLPGIHTSETKKPNHTADYWGP